MSWGFDIAMKWLLIAIIVLTQQPAKVPPPEKANEASRTESTRNTKAAKNAQTQTIQATPAASQSPIGIESQRSVTTANSHTQQGNGQANEDSSTQRKLTWFTGVLAGVGALQLIVMFLTWMVYRRQAREMRRQRHEMRRQRHVMHRQWLAIRAQVSEMTVQRGIMGNQLTTMDNQVAEMKGQTDALKQSVAVAKASADTALRAIKLQEVQLEQWIDTAQWEAVPINVEPDATEAFLPIRFAIINTTKFKMILDVVDIWIDREKAITVLFRKQLLTPDGGSTTVDFHRKLTEMRLERYRKGFLRFEIGGIVSYVDAFGQAQEQRFGFHCSCYMNRSADFQPIAFYPPDAEEIEAQKRRKDRTQQSNQTDQPESQNYPEGPN